MPISKVKLLFYLPCAVKCGLQNEMLIATYSNHSKIITIHEASYECIWLRLVIQHIQDKRGLSLIKDTHIILYEDNVACITQIRGGYIKVDITKHISPKLFYTSELQKNSEIDIRQNTNK